MSQDDLPIHVDDPKYFLVFRMDQFVAMIAGMGFGIIAHALGTAIILMVIGNFALSHFREHIQDGMLGHMFYYFGLPVGKGHSLIDPYVREFIS